MTCPDDERLGALVAGELSASEAAALDEHLLSCEECWRAVQEDRRGRLAVDLLREAGPPGLADRVAAVIGLGTDQQETLVGLEPDTAKAVSEDCGRDEPGTGRPGRAGPFHRAVASPAGGWVSAARRHRLRTSLAAVLASGGLTAGLVAAFASGGGPGDPAQVAAVVVMASHAGATGAPTAAPRHLMVEGQEIDVHSSRVDGRLVEVATSARQFPMPSTSHVVAGSSQHAWMASRGSLSMYCVNRPPGQQSMLLVAGMPAAELPQVAAELHLI